MSLLLDALKKAAEQKNEKEGASDTELETNIDASRAISGAEVDFPVSEDQAERTVLDLDATDIGGEVDKEDVDQTDFLKDEDTQLGQDDWSLEDSTAFSDADNIGATDFARPAYDDLDERSDTIVDETGLGFEGGSNTDTGGLHREWQALSGDTQFATATSTESAAHSPGFDYPSESSAGAVSLTENIESERASFVSNENQAAYMFSNKAPGSGDAKRKVALYGVLAGMFVLLGFMYGYEYIMDLSDDSASYRPVRPSRPMQLEPKIESSLGSAEDMDEAMADSSLLVEQEDYAALLDDELGTDISVADKESTVDTKNTESKTALAKIDQPKTKATKRPAFKPNPRTEIQISKRARTRPLQELLLEAYDAYHVGEPSKAENLYQQVLTRDQKNRDALLGMGALALQAQNFATAETYYSRVLSMDPRDTYAIAGMEAIKSSQGPGKSLSESQLKHLLSQQPQAHELHFSLGNLYARQMKWPAAQKSYFAAYRLDNKNPDYLFNLAVSLDHLGQSKSAVQFYEEAITASSIRANHFDIAAVNKRLQMLSEGKPE